MIRNRARVRRLVFGLVALVALMSCNGGEPSELDAVESHADGLSDAIDDAADEAALAVSDPDAANPDDMTAAADDLRDLVEEGRALPDVRGETYEHDGRTVEGDLVDIQLGEVHAAAERFADELHAFAGAAVDVEVVARVNDAWGEARAAVEALERIIRGGDA